LEKEASIQEKLVPAKLPHIAFRRSQLSGGEQKEK
jgi:hypothetical protein